MSKRQNIPEEWTAFQENARRYDDEVPERRYGIVNPSVDNPQTDTDMLYASDPLTLHNMHWDNWPSVALRDHLDWCEKMDGKISPNFSSIIR